MINTTQIPAANGENSRAGQLGWRDEELFEILTENRDKIEQEYLNAALVNQGISGQQLSITAAAKWLEMDEKVLRFMTIRFSDMFQACELDGHAILDGALLVENRSEIADMEAAVLSKGNGYDDVREFLTEYDRKAVSI